MEYKMKFFVASAKAGIGVHEAFITLATDVVLKLETNQVVNYQ